MTIRTTPVAGSRHRAKRVGRGNASHGTYCGRGMKGQKARTGGKIRAQFEGGQTPFFQKMPKLKGFNNPNKITYRAINLNRLEYSYAAGETVNLESLRAKGYISKNDRFVKILGTGDLTKKLTVDIKKVSAGAKTKIEQAGGTVIVTAAKAVKAVKKE